MSLVRFQDGRLFDGYIYYPLPNVELPEQDNRPIGVWGQRRKRYLKEHHKMYYNLLTQCKLHSHLADVEEEAQAMFSRLVDELAEKENITEQFKANNPMLWIQSMNNIRNRAMEVVNAEVIFT